MDAVPMTIRLLLIRFKTFFSYLKDQINPKFKEGVREGVETEG